MCLDVVAFVVWACLWRYPSVYKPGKVCSIIDKTILWSLWTSSGCHRPPRSSSWQKGCRHQAVGWRFQGATFPPRHRCRNRALPPKSYPANGSEEVGSPKQSKALHQGAFYFLGGLVIAIFISLFRLSTTRTCSLHVTPLNWRPSRDPWLASPSRSHHKGRMRRRWSRSCSRIVTQAERTSGSSNRWECVTILHLLLCLYWLRIL